jgi:peptidoglycan/xylan/chitin deacetylase (PgdA/CDA1 family)
MTATMYVAAGAALAAGWSPLYYATYAVRSQWLGATDWRGQPERPTVALTFDDGPSDDTERILDVLAEYSARAAFFVIGRQVERHPRIARRIVDEGHEIGNHSYSHPIYLYATPARTREELARAQRVIADVTGVAPTWSRPPCGVRTPAYFSAARALRLRTVQWSATGHDWRLRDADRIAARVLRASGPGAIVLLHDGDSRGATDRLPTVGALARILSGLSARALRPESLSQLLPSRSAAAAKGDHV